MGSRKAATPDVVAGYSTTVTLDDGTWARVWHMSGDDMKAIRTIDAEQAGAFDVTLDRLAGAVIDFAGPKPDAPFTAQPLSWLLQVLKGWTIAQKEGGLPPVPAEGSDSP